MVLARRYGSINTMSPNKELFETLVKLGFEPLKTQIEFRKLQLSDEDINKICQTIARGLKQYTKWLKHIESHS